MNRGVLIIGNFNNRTSLEVYTNQRLYNEYVKQGVSVKCLDISGYNCPFHKVETIKIDFNIKRILYIIILNLIIMII